MPGGSPAISWKSAECSESTGSSCAPVASASVRHELAAHHEALLVGEREVDALAERRHRRAEPGGAHQRVQHEVAVGIGDQLDEPLGTREHLQPSECSDARAAASGSASATRLDAVLLRLLDEQLPA